MAQENRSGAYSGAVVAHLGPVLARLGSILAHLGLSWRHLGLSLALSWPMLGHLRSSQGHLEISWAHLLAQERKKAGSKIGLQFFKIRDQFRTPGRSRLSSRRRVVSRRRSRLSSRRRVQVVK